MLSQSERACFVLVGYTCLSVLIIFKTATHARFSLCFFLFFPIVFPQILIIMSSSDEIDDPAAVESSGSDFDEEIATQEPRKKRVGDTS